MNALKTYTPERRKSIRIPFWSILRYRIRDEVQTRRNNDVTYGNSLNLSVGGLCFETFEQIPIGAHLVLTLALPMYPLRKLKIEGEVLRCEKINLTDLYTIALSFKDVNDTDRFAFAEFIEHFLK
ncbi:unnamed protein product [marine sediment metagenome]|uniref:PilZ domain-containing protein n=1 Tax=marine sediment metagenome TaxID=412755 RepID=X0W453_9ZZZZ